MNKSLLIKVVANKRNYWISGATTVSEREGGGEDGDVSPTELEYF